MMAYQNAITGTIPTQVGRYTDLGASFSVYMNSLSGTMPTELGACRLWTVPRASDPRSPVRASRFRAIPPASLSGRNGGLLKKKTDPILHTLVQRLSTRLRSAAVPKPEG